MITWFYDQPTWPPADEDQAVGKVHEQHRRHEFQYDERRQQDR